MLTELPPHPEYERCRRNPNDRDYALLKTHAAFSSTCPSSSDDFLRVTVNAMFEPPKPRAAIIPLTSCKLPCPTRKAVVVVSGGNGECVCLGSAAIVFGPTVMAQHRGSRVATGCSPRFGILTHPPAPSR
jgi:hypothetical protein